MSRAIQLWRQGRMGISAIRDRLRGISQAPGLFQESTSGLSPVWQDEKQEALRMLSWSPLSSFGAGLQSSQLRQAFLLSSRGLSSSSVWRAASEHRGAASEEAKPAAGVAEEEHEKPVASVEDLKRVIGELEAKKQESEEAVKDLTDKLLRTFADMENLRERTQRELENLRKYANQEFAKDLLPVADILSMAQASIPKEFRTPGAELDATAATKMLTSLLTGVEMTEKELLRVFKKHGLERSDPTGEPFNPNVHMAQFEVPDDTKEPGTIHTVIKVGYILHDRVIRPAEVGIVRDPEA